MSESEMPDGLAGQETGDQPSATTLRERLLQSNVPVEVTLPKAGVVRIRPSLSLGALEAFSAADSPPLAFRAMVAESVEDSRASSLELQDEDDEVIARMYATGGGFLPAFDEARKGMAVAEAFSASLTSSKAWQLTDESRLVVPDLFGDHFKGVQRVIDSYASSFHRFDHAYARIADIVPKFELPDLAVPSPT